MLVRGAVVMKVNPEKIPDTLKQLAQWVVWKEVRRGGELTKIPFTVAGQPASSTEPASWSTFAAALESYQKRRYHGVGFVFHEADGLVGVDLDGCRDPKNGKLSAWAEEIIRRLDSYTELSPSGTGFKVFVRGQWGAGGKSVKLDYPAVCDKAPGIEVYERGRYFTVTGRRLSVSASIEERSEALRWLKERFWPQTNGQYVHNGRNGHSNGRAHGNGVVERARRYLQKVPPAVSGQGGHNQTFKAACALVLGFDLGGGEAYQLLEEWNHSCQPPWSERELRHKIDSALKQSGERGYLRDARPEEWDSIGVPYYVEDWKEELTVEPKTVEPKAQPEKEIVKGPEPSRAGQVRQILDIARTLDKQSLLAVIHALLNEVQFHDL